VAGSRLLTVTTDFEEDIVKRSYATGLVIAGLLGLSDIASLPFGDGEHPPLPVAAAGAVLGLITLVGAWYAWRGRRGGIVAVIVSRLLSAATALPAFFVDGVPPGFVALAAFGVAVTLLAVGLVAVGLRRPAEAPAAATP
jgi:hypothetical protein